MATTVPLTLRILDGMVGGDTFVARRKDRIERQRWHATGRHRTP